MELYKDAGWVHYIKDPERLKRAYENSLYIASAFHGKKLVGALRAVGDGETILFIQDILLLESYQRKSIGSSLMKLALDRYKNVRQKGLLTDETPETVAFYESNGFNKSTDKCMVYFVRIDKT